MKIAVIGGGASGALCACELGKAGLDVTLFEKNEKIGKKLYITGKGRCNLTNDCDKEEFLLNVVRNQKFLYSSIYTFDSNQTMEYFEDLGLTLKTERGNRVFPMSDKSSDVIKALQNNLKWCHVNVRLNINVISVEKIGDKFQVKTDFGDFVYDKVIVATGGITYKSTGSTGDGYIFAKNFGHTIVEPKGTLLGLKTKTNYKLAGLTLKNVVLNAKKGKKLLFSDMGEMLFTHEGISGPIVLSSSSILAREKLSDLEFSIDLKPALSAEKLDERILRDFEKYMNKDYRHALVGLLPSSMIDIVVKLSGIPPYQKVNVITRQEREKLLNVLKAFPLDVYATSDEDNGIITAGGVKVSEVSPTTMMSKKEEGLYFIGEVLDVDAKTGGFNLQIAFATAKVCAEGIVDEASLI